MGAIINKSSSLFRSLSQSLAISHNFSQPRYLWSRMLSNCRRLGVYELLEPYHEEHLVSGISKHAFTTLLQSGPCSSGPCSWLCHNVDRLLLCLAHPAVTVCEQYWFFWRWALNEAEGVPEGLNETHLQSGVPYREPKESGPTPNSSSEWSCTERNNIKLANFINNTMTRTPASIVKFQTKVGEPPLSGFLSRNICISHRYAAHYLFVNSDHWYDHFLLIKVGSTSLRPSVNHYTNDRKCTWPWTSQSA